MSGCQGEQATVNLRSRQAATVLTVPQQRAAAPRAPAPGAPYSVHLTARVSAAMPLAPAGISGSSAIIIGCM